MTSCPKPHFHKKAKYRGVPKEVREAILLRSDGICEGPIVCNAGMRTCGHRATELAHIEHRKMGGSRELDTEENLLYVCKSCHDKFDGRTY